MITKSKTEKNNFLNKAMIAPLFFILLSIYAFRIDDDVKPNFVKSKQIESFARSSGNKSISTTGINLPDTLPGSNTKSRIYTKVEFEADYPGGPNAWVEYLRKNLRYPGKAADNEVQGEVVVQFIVSKKGEVSDVRAISGPDELKEEAIKIVRESGKWEPAREGNRKVNCYKRQPIIFRLEHQ